MSEQSLHKWNEVWWGTRWWEVGGGDMGLLIKYAQDYYSIVVWHRGEFIVIQCGWGERDIRPIHFLPCISARLQTACFLHKCSSSLPQPIAGGPTMLFFPERTLREIQCLKLLASFAFVENRTACLSAVKERNRRKEQGRKRDVDFPVGRRWCAVKGITQKWKFSHHLLTSCCSKPVGHFSSANHKSRYFEKCFCSYNGVQNNTEFLGKKEVVQVWNGMRVTNHLPPLCVFYFLSPFTHFYTLPDWA